MRHCYDGEQLYCAAWIYCCKLIMCACLTGSVANFKSLLVHILVKWSLVKGYPPVFSSFLVSFYIWPLTSVFSSAFIDPVDHAHCSSLELFFSGISSLFNILTSVWCFPTPSGVLIAVVGGSRGSEWKWEQWFWRVWLWWLGVGGEWHCCHAMLVHISFNYLPSWATYLFYFHLGLFLASSRWLSTWQ